MYSRKIRYRGHSLKIFPNASALYPQNGRGKIELFPARRYVLAFFLLMRLTRGIAGSKRGRIVRLTREIGRHTRYFTAVS